MAARRSDIDLIELEKLCTLSCTDEEIAAWFGTSTRTIERRRKEPKFAEIMARGKAKGRISIRRMQMKLLEQGNATMGVWLGKQLLGQRDQIDTEIRPRLSLRELSAQQLRAVLEDYARDYPELAGELNVLDTEYTVVKPDRRLGLPPSSQTNDRPACLCSPTEVMSPMHESHWIRTRFNRQASRPRRFA